MDEKFEIKLGLLGNEILSFGIHLNSPRKMWAVIGLAAAWFAVDMLLKIYPVMGV